MSDSTPYEAPDWHDLDNHDAHIRMLAEREGNWLACKDHCTGTYQMANRILELTAALERADQDRAQAQARVRDLGATLAKTESRIEMLRKFVLAHRFAKSDTPAARHMLAILRGEDDGRETGTK